LQFGLSGHFTKLGHFGCHGLDELLLSEPRIENLELQAGKTQQTLNCTEVLLWCLVLAQEVEQRAYVPGGLFRPPACLDKAKTSRSAADFSQTWWILWQTLSALVECKRQCIVKGFSAQGWTDRTS